MERVLALMDNRYHLLVRWRGGSGGLGLSG